jgi:hypothetical protein
MPLPVLPYYLLKPVWGEQIPRFMAYADKETLTVIDNHKNSKFTINLASLPGLAGLTKTELVLAANLPQGRIVFSLRESRDPGAAAKSFFLNLQDGQVSPLPEEFFDYLIAKGLGEATWAWHQDRDAAWGKPLVSLLVQRGKLSEQESEALIFLPTFFNPHISYAEPFSRRLLAYGSREELVIKDTFAGKTERVDLQALRPEDYHAIDNIDLYSNMFGDEICIVLSAFGIKQSAYIWRAGNGLVKQTEAIPTEMNPAGWSRMHRGTPDFVFREIRLDTGGVAALTTWNIWLAAFKASFYEFALWSLVLVICFGLPYVLAHLITLRLAPLLNKARNVSAIAAMLSSTLFVLFSIITVYASGIMLHAHINTWLLPLPWGDPLSSKAAMAMLIAIIFFTPAIVALALLNSWQTKVFLGYTQGMASGVYSSRQKWNFWGIAPIASYQKIKWRYPLHCYATLLGCVLMAIYLFGFRLGFFLEIEIAWLIFCLAALIPYTFARPLSVLVAKRITQNC